MKQTVTLFSDCKRRDKSSLLSVELRFEICIGCRWLTVVHCSPMNDSNMFVNSSETERGTSVMITCYPGYLINGQTSALVNCGSDGQWSLTNATCQRRSP